MVRYRVKSGKVHRRENGKMVVYRAGDVLEAEPYEVRGFRDLLERLDGQDEGPRQEALALEQPKSLVIQHRGAGKYNVLGVDGEPINTRLLNREEAERLVLGRAVEDGDTKDQQSPQDKENQKDDPAPKSVGTGKRLPARRRTKFKGRKL